MFLEPQQPLQVAVVVNLPRPVVAEHDVGRLVLQLLQPEDLEVPDVIGRPAAVVVIRRLLEVTEQVISTLGRILEREKQSPYRHLVDSRESSYSDPVHLHHSRVSQVENVGRYPASVGQLL